MITGAIKVNRLHDVWDRMFERYVDHVLNRVASKIEAQSSESSKILTTLRKKRVKRRSRI